MTSQIGFVYILANEYMPNVYKIGCTERSPRARADEISNATGVPTAFQVLCYAEFQGFQAVERNLHEWLSSYRVNQNREFFHDCLTKAVAFLWFHPERIAFTDATAGSGSPFDNELVMRVCKEPHETYLDDLANPWRANDPEEAERIALKKRFAAGDFGEDEIPSIANVVPELDGTATPAFDGAAEGAAAPALKLVAGGAA